MKVNERHVWAAQLLDVQPSEKILEIGCGPGITLNLVSEKIENGKVHAIDRSGAMLKQANKRNREKIDIGKVELLKGNFGKTPLPLKNYDKVYAFNVNFFSKNSEAEFRQIKNLIGHKGHFYLFSQPPIIQSKQIVQNTIDYLKNKGFKNITSEVAPFEPSPTFCIIASIECKK